MLSSTLWCHLAPSFHEYENVGHQLLQKWHHYSVHPSHKSAPLPPLHQNYLYSNSFFFYRRQKNLTYLNSMISQRTQNPGSITNALHDPQIGIVGLNNKPQVFPPFFCMSDLPTPLAGLFLQLILSQIKYHTTRNRYCDTSSQISRTSEAQT